MADQEDYYQVLGVSPDASLDEIRRARRSKAMEYHPDRLAGVSEGVRRLAEEELKKINAAYDVLRDPDKRRQYDSEDLRKSPPIPEITPKIIRFDNVEPGRMQRNSFVVRNVGGACSKINIGDTDPWLRITGYKSLTQGDTFPLQVDLEAQGQGFGQTYQETVTVSLDESKATVRVELSTEVAPQPRASGIGQATSPATPGSTTSTSYQSGATTVPCPVCNYQNPRFASNCNSCGASLGRSATRTSAAAGSSGSTARTIPAKTGIPGWFILTALAGALSILGVVIWGIASSGGTPQTASPAKVPQAAESVDGGKQLRGSGGVQTSAGGGTQPSASGDMQLTSGGPQADANRTASENSVVFPPVPLDIPLETLTTSLITKLEFSPSPVRILEGEMGSVDLLVKDFTDSDGLGGYGVTIKFDPAVVEVEAVLSGDPLFDTPICNSVPSTTGNVRCVGFQGSQHPGPTGGIRLLSLSLLAVGAAGSETALGIYGINGDPLIDTFGNGLLVSGVSGQVIIGGH